MSLITSADTADSVLDLFPEEAVVTVQLYSRTAGDIFSPPVGWQATKMPVEKRPVGVLGGELPGASTSWLLVRQAQAVVPTEQDRFVDSAGTTWQIESVTVEQFDICYVCACTMATPLSSG